jgi:hypothetical protein
MACTVVVARRGQQRSLVRIFPRVEWSGVGAPDARDAGVWLRIFCRWVAWLEWPLRRSGCPGR